MSDRIASALGLACCAALGVIAAVALADPIVTVTDGDSLRINGERVRLAFVDAPELGQYCLDASRRPYACGEASANALRAMIARDPGVACERKDTDRYGRMVAVCRNGQGQDLGAMQVARGMALDYTRYSGGAYKDEQDAAKAEHLGIWQGEFLAPYLWRQHHARTPRP